MLNGIDKRNYKKDKTIGRFIGRIETEQRERDRLNLIYQINHQQRLDFTREPRKIKVNTQEPIFNFEYLCNEFDEPIAKVFVTDNTYKDPLPNKYNTIDKFGFHKTSVEGGEFNTFIDERDFASDFNMRNIQTIHNVYQEKYEGGVNATGFGDFIRGCYYLLDFCDRNGKEFVVTINHTISNFLEATQPAIEDDVIPFFVYNNCQSHSIDHKGDIRTRTGDDVDERFIKYLAHSAKRRTNKCYVYNIVYPSHDIGEPHKERIRQLLKPNQMMREAVANYLPGLVHYNIVHIRSGDKYISGARPINNESYIDRLEEEINQVNHPILLIADNISVKKLLMERNPGLKPMFVEITHFGEGFKQEYEAVKNTLLDFYLMSNAQSIVSLTCYEHGSGFSQWCATTYNIPYKCKFIKA